jgi:hypothetical protein
MPQKSGEHVVHTQSCPQLEMTPFRVNLGEYETCDEAMQRAKVLFQHVCGCAQCAAAGSTN